MDLDLRRVPRRCRDQRDHPGARGRCRAHRPRAPRDPGTARTRRSSRARSSSASSTCSPRASFLAWAISIGAPSRARRPLERSRASTSRGSSRTRCSSTFRSRRRSSSSALVGIWIAGHVADFRDRVAQAFRVMSPPDPLSSDASRSGRRPTGSLRLVTIWFLLDAFDIPQTVRTSVSCRCRPSVATLFPITPAGVGTEQAFLLYVLAASPRQPCSSPSASGPSSRSTVTNVVAGFTAIALTLRTVRFNKALGPTPDDRRSRIDCGAPLRALPGSRLSCTRSRLRTARLVELRVEVARRLLRQPGDALELLLRRLEESLDRAEVADDRAASHRPDAGQRLEDRLHRSCVARLRRW